jgi:hypothetical protein
MKRTRELPRWAAEALEPLVLVCTALAGPRAAALLGGLVAPIDTEAVELLETSERRPTPERHAGWVRAFQPPPGPLPASSDVPGRLGELLQARLVERGPVLAELESPEAPWVRWSSRLALEQRGADVASRHLDVAGGRRTGDAAWPGSRSSPPECLPSPQLPGRSISCAGRRGASPASNASLRDALAWPPS